MLKNANRSFLGVMCRRGACAGSLRGVLCSFLLLASSVASAQAQEQRDNRRERTRPASKLTGQDRAREFDPITAQPPNSIQVQVRYKKEYGYKGDSGAFGASGPTSSDAFFISTRLDPSVRLEHLYGIQHTDRMRESNGFYVCDFLVTDLPLNAPIKVGVDLADHRSLPFEAWKGGSQAQPPPGEERTIIIVGGRSLGVSRADAKIQPRSRAQDTTVTLTQSQPRATLVFEMVYALPAGAVTAIDKLDAKAARDKLYADTVRTDTDAPQYQELRCRGGAGLRFVAVEGRTNSSGEQTNYMTVYFHPAAQPAEASGRNLQPGQCAFPERAVRADESYRIVLEIVYFGQTRQQLHGTPVDTSPTAAERYPDAQNVPQYLGDPKHYWSFFVHQNAPLPFGFFEASYGRYWKPTVNGIWLPGDSAVKDGDPAFIPTTPPEKGLGRLGNHTPVIDVNPLAAKGEAIANADPLAVELRNRQPEGLSRRGFDIGMTATEGQTLPGPGKQRIHDSLSPAEQAGFDIAVSFSLERNRNADLAVRGAAIANVDPIVAEARTVETDVFYWLGFDIATGIFGDPALGARGNTATGPGSLGIRDSLSAAGQRGFNASVTLHLSRNYRR